MSATGLILSARLWQPENLKKRDLTVSSISAFSAKIWLSACDDRGQIMVQDGFQENVRRIHFLDKKVENWWLAHPVNPKTEVTCRHPFQLIEVDANGTRWQKCGSCFRELKV